MPKNYDGRNTARTGGKAHGQPSQPRCKTCGDSGTVRVSKPLIRPGDAPAKQRYEVVTERCPDCR